MKEELKRQWSKVKEVSDSSPKLQPSRVSWVFRRLHEAIDLGVRKGRLETEIQLQRSHHFDLLWARLSMTTGELRLTGGKHARTTAIVVRTHRITQLLVIGGTSLTQASIAC